MGPQGARDRTTPESLTHPRARDSVRYSLHQHSAHPKAPLYPSPQKPHTKDTPMSNLTDLLTKVRAADPTLAADLEREIKARQAPQRRFGLVFENHRPEAVELPSREVREGDKVRVLPPRGETKKSDQTLWHVDHIDRTTSTAHLTAVNGDQDTQATVTDLVVVAEFRDHMYPGLIETGRVENGGDKPFHTVINAENFHALEMLTYTHRHKVDCIYIDPPYNTGAKDWKYNNDYVEPDDDYRHSKWLSFMERRLILSRELLNSQMGTLIVAIDENEQHRLHMLIEQIFAGWSISPVSVVHNPRGIQGDIVSMTHETYFIVTPSGKKVRSVRPLSEEEIEKNASPLRNWGSESRRSDAATCFYPIYVKDGIIVGFGKYLDRDDPTHPSRNEPGPDGSIAIWPIDSKGVERKWRYSRSTVEDILHLLRVKNVRGGSLDIEIVKTHGPVKSIWSGTKYDANTHGTQLVSSLIPGRRFPFPKSLYAVEDAIRFFSGDNPEAVVLDFFSGSGTTAHAVMRLNKQDGGRRQCISVTNNEVSAEEQKGLRKKGLRPGDPGWEQWGICDYVTKPRVTAAITGKTPAGDPIKGDYKFTDEFPMADGFEENAAFFTLTYESPLMVRQDLAFKRIAPLLWMRAGSRGRVITEVPARGWDVAEAYGVLTKVDRATPFAEAVAEAGVGTVYVVTDDERRCQAVCALLPEDVTPVRLYESYLTNFEINTGGRTNA